MLDIRDYDELNEIVGMNRSEDFNIKPRSLPLLWVVR